MHARLATQDDLPQIKSLFKAIVKNMDTQGIQIWDDVYPCEFFAEDIECERLYVLEMPNDVNTNSNPYEYDASKPTTSSSILVAAFALCGEPENAHCVQWQERDAEALYLYRLGVSVEHGRRGVGARALEKAATLARQLGAEYLRLFVVDVNEPAINLYLKSGYHKVAGIRDEPLGDVVLKEYGFELNLTS